MLQINELEKRVEILTGRYTHSSAVIARGKSIARSADILKYEISEQGQNEYIIKSTVQGSERKPYHTTIAFNVKKGIMRYSSCTCPYDWGGLCKHRVALLFRFCANMRGCPSEGSDSPSELKLQKKILLLNNAVAENKLMKSDFEPLLNALNFSPKKNYKLYIDVSPYMPYAYFSDSQRRFSMAWLKREVVPITQFKIEFSMTDDGGKSYKIHGFKKFIEALRNRGVCQWRKNPIRPEMTDFKESDRDILGFILRLNSLSGRYQSFSYSGSSIILEQALLSDFLYLFGGYPQVKHFGEPVRISDFPYKTVLEVKNTESGISLFPAIKNGGRDAGFDSFGFFQGQSNYLLLGQKIYKVNSSDDIRLLDMFSQMLNTRDELSFPEDKSIYFYRNVLPLIREKITVTTGKKSGLAVATAPLAVSCYMDYVADKNIIFAKIEFDYGGKKFSLLPDKKGDYRIPVAKKGNKYRNIEKELDIISRFLDFGFIIKDEEKMSFNSHEPEKLADLIIDFIPGMQKCAAFYYSEEFKKISANSKIDIRIETEYNLDWFEVKFSFKAGENEIPADILLKNIGKKYIRLKNGALLPLPGDLLDRLSAVLDDSGINISAGKGVSRVPVYGAGYFFEEIKKIKGVTTLLNERAEEFLEKFNSPKTFCARKLPAEVHKKLRKYQVEGFHWLSWLSDLNICGVLADDMGLGKTVQAISFLKSETKKNKDMLPNLIICPTSLVYNWQREFEKFFPKEKDMIVIYGNKSERRRLLKHIPKKKYIITSYPVFSRDLSAYGEYSYNYVVLDEAQHIKNPETNKAKGVKLLKAQKRLVLTGTPIENNLIELWSIFDFLMPGFLHSKSKFIKKYNNPISKGNSPDVLNRLKRKISPFILRRLKKDVLPELPAKMNQIIYTELTDCQKAVYMATLQRVKKEISEQIKVRGFDNSKIHVLAGITKLRLICCHPEAAGFKIKKGEYGSGKCQAFLELVEEAIDGGHKLVVFSQFVKMLHILERKLKKEKIKYEYLDGSTKDRMARVDSFNNSPEIPLFLCSLKAGGLGLNLTSADMVIHYDQWWNPAVQEQATDRVHRIGQARKVVSYVLISKGTIEEKILELQKRKKHLIDSVLETGGAGLSKLRWEDVKEILEM